MLDRVRKYLLAPVSGSSLAVFRITFGVVMVFQALEFFLPKNAAGDNLITLFYAGPKVHWHFSYFGFSWIKPFPQPWMNLWFVALLVSSFLVAIGAFYRLAIAGVFCTFTYVWMMDQAWYLNHFYLASLLAFLLMFMPANAKWSVDSWWKRKKANGVSEPQTVPFWCLFLLRLQMFLPYFYGGVAKISADWLAGEPVRMWVQGNAIGKYLSHFLSPSQMQMAQEVLRSEAIVWLLVYGGLIFDLAIGFLLIFRRTRLFGLALVAGFHGVNFFLFNIGVFPVMATASTLIFLESDWPDRFWAWLRKPRFREPDWPWFLGGLLLFPPFGAALGWKLAPAAGVDASSTGSERGRGQWWVFPFVVGWTVVQFVVPLRHYAIPGNVLWTDEGSNFAWLMMLRNKEGSAQFFVVDPALASHADPVVAYGDFAKTDKLPLLEYRFMDAASLDWSKLPEFLVIREPLAGERIVFNRTANGPLSYEESVLRVRDYWMRTYGRRPAVAKPRRLSDVLHDLATKVAATSRAGNDQAVPPLLQRLAMALSAANQLSQKYEQGSGDFQLTMSLQLCLAHARDADGSNRILRNSFGTISPFSMQGNPASVAPVLLIEDKELLRQLPRTGTALNWDAWKGPRREYLDLERMEPLFLRPLPLLIVGRDASGESKVAWNYARDLTEFQLRAMRCFPYLQYKYVQRIAGWWEEQFQRRPRVYVMSLQQLNHHPMQPAIDPKVDLASQEYRLLDHNSWYLPLRRQEEWSEKVE